jgi:cytochrome P450
MPTISDLLNLPNPPGTESENLPTRRTRGRRYVPPWQILGVLLRAFWPIPRFFRWALVTRHEDVEEVLSHPDVFGVPFGDEIARLNDGEAPGTPFLLGMDRQRCHGEQLRHVMKAFKREDVANIVQPKAAEAASDAVAAGAGRLEAIGELITHVPIEICRAYYGVPIGKGNQKQFADAAIALSGHLFGLPPIKPDKNVEAAIVRAVVDDAIGLAKSAAPSADTVAARLVRIPGLSDKEIRAILIGMIIGFVPTNTMAGGNILDMLLRKKGFRQEARQAALHGDDDLLAHCLFEALRFMPINVGPFRECRQDYVIAAGTSRQKRIPKGTHVLASTQSAMFDWNVVQSPFQFIPSRPASSFMHFGFGMHWCVGAFIAQAQIVQTFKALLLKDDLRRAPGRAGRMKRSALFPQSLTVLYTP